MYYRIIEARLKRKDLLLFIVQNICYSSQIKNNWIAVELKGRNIFNFQIKWKMLH